METGSGERNAYFPTGGVANSCCRMAVTRASRYNIGALNETPKP